MLAVGEALLANKLDAEREARVRIDLGRLYDGPLDDVQKAIEHYRKARELAPELAETTTLLRRALLAAGQYRDAVSLFDEELRVVAAPATRARLWVEKGRILEQRLHLPGKAREAYEQALELTPRDVTVLRAAARAQLRAQAWQALSGTYERLAQAVSDPRLHAAAQEARARLAESQADDRNAAVSLYGTALEQDPRAPGALDGLKRLAAREKRYSELARAFEREASQLGAPQDRAEALGRAAHVYEEHLGDLERAADALERAIGEAPSDVPLLRALAHVYERMGRHQALLPILERVAGEVDEPRERAALLERMGRIASDLGDDTGACRAREAAFQLDPSYEPAADALASIYEGSGDDEALVELRVKQARAGNDPRVTADMLARAGHILETRLRRYDEAAALYAEATAAQPDHLVAFDALGRLLARAGKWRELVELYRRAVDRAPDDERANGWLFRIGGVYEDRLDEPESAMHAYRRILDRHPEHRGALVALQRAAERAGDDEELVSALEREADVSDDPERALALTARAARIVADRIGDPDRAIARLRRVLESDPKHVDTLRALGNVYRREGRWDELLETWRRLKDAVTDAESRARLLFQMGRVSERELGRGEQAVTYYFQALEVEPKHQAAKEALVSALEAQSAYGELAKLLEGELEGAPPSEVARRTVRLGELYETRLGKTDAALEMYKRALDANPSYTPARDGLERLLEAKGAYRELAATLAEQADRAADPVVRVELRYREGRVREGRLGELDAPIACFEAVLAEEPEHIGALLGLEELLARAERVGDLAEVYRKQAEVFADPPARLAALRELANLQALHELGSTTDRRRTLEAVLELSPDDQDALEALAQVAELEGSIPLLVSIEDRLARLAGDEPGHATYHKLRFASLLEATGEPRALEAYRSALESDPHALTAARGFSRLAEQRADPDTLAEAARYERDVLGDHERAAALLLRAAHSREQGRELAGAARDLLRALELEPSQDEIAERLERVLLSLGQATELVDRLEQAAEGAPDAGASVALRLREARIQAEVLGDAAAAAATLERAKKTHPRDTVLLQRLGEYLERTRRFEEAADVMHQLVRQLDDPDVLERTHLRLAALSEEQLGDTGRATASLHAVLEKKPNHAEALTRLANIEAKRGDYERAGQTAKKLVEQAQGPAERARALTLIGRVERAQGHDARADDALLKAIALEGPSGDAAAEYKRGVQGAQGWQSYAEALRQYQEQASRAGIAVAHVYREIADVFYRRLSRPDDALSYLQRAAQERPGDVDLGLAHAGLLYTMGRHPQAIDEARRALAHDPTRADGFRLILACRKAIGDEMEAAAAVAPLAVLGAATPEEQQQLERRPRQPAMGEPGRLGDDRLARIEIEGALRHPALRLLGAIPETIGKLHPPQLAAYGVSKRDRLSSRSEDPIRALVDRLAMLLGVGELELYVHDAQVSDVGLELTHPVSVMAPSWLRSLDEAQAVFMLARTLVLLSRDAQAVARLTAEDLGELLTGAAAAAGVSVAPPAGLTADAEDLAQRVSRAMPRRERKTFEDAARAYGSSPLGDVAAWQRAVRMSAARAALLLADDLAASLKIWRRSSGEGIAPGTVSADLMLFWVSLPATEYRRQG